jgi:hypothetical protein
LSLESRIIVRFLIFEAERTNRGYLSDVLAGHCPVEVPCVAGQNDDAAGRIGLQAVTVESIAQADVENTGDDRIESRSSGCLYGMSFTPAGSLTLIRYGPA